MKLRAQYTVSCTSYNNKNAFGIFGGTRRNTKASGYSFTGIYGAFAPRLLSRCSRAAKADADWRLSNNRSVSFPETRFSSVGFRELWSSGYASFFGAVVPGGSFIRLPRELWLGNAWIFHSPCGHHIGHADHGRVRNRFRHSTLCRDSAREEPAGRAGRNRRSVVRRRARPILVGYFGQSQQTAFGGFLAGPACPHRESRAIPLHPASSLLFLLDDVDRRLYRDFGMVADSDSHRHGDYLYKGSQAGGGEILPYQSGARLSRLSFPHRTVNSEVPVPAKEDVPGRTFTAGSLSGYAAGLA